MKLEIDQGSFIVFKGEGFKTSCIFITVLNQIGPIRNRTYSRTNNLLLLLDKGKRYFTLYTLPTFYGFYTPRKYFTQSTKPSSI